MSLSAKPADFSRETMSLAMERVGAMQKAAVLMGELLEV
jgi:hypothetical protein